MSQMSVYNALILRVLHLPALLLSIIRSGGQTDVTKDHLISIEDKSDYIIQKKIDYRPVIKSHDDEYQKTEIRRWELITIEIKPGLDQAVLTIPFRVFRQLYFL